MTDRHVLERAIRHARWRWVARTLVGGLGIVAATAVVLALVTGLVVDHFRFAAAAVTGARLLGYVLLGALVVRFVILPLRKRLSEARVALYLEEREPSLDSSVVSAVEFAGEPEVGGSSPAFVERVVQSAVERLSAVEYGRRVERAALRRSSTVLAGAALAALVLLWNPSPVVRGASVLLPWNTAADRNPYRVDVAPGDTVVARGSDLRVRARLVNFTADAVDLVLKRGGQAEWERWPMTVEQDSGHYAAFLLDLSEAMQYFVEAAGVRSPLVQIGVADLPYVKEIALEYQFPAYTGLAPQRVEGSGDIAALRGTVVRVEVTPTIPVAGAFLATDGADTVALTPAPTGQLTGQLRVEREGFYRVIFDATRTGRVVGSPEYLIDVFDDQPPVVRFTTPGRDVNVTAVEEVFVEAKAEDDYGVARLELVYSVNGGPEQTVRLYQGGSARREVTAGHTFFLEEEQLAPGDFISYYARAVEAPHALAAQVALSDIYFLKVRPWDRSYRQADEQPGTGGGAGMNSALSEQQREIVAGTFNVVRDRTQYADDAYRENLATLALAQGRLREEVETLVGRIRSRGVVALDSNFRVIAEALGAAVPEMQEAEELLGRRDPQAALGPEQRALQQLQRAEAAFREVQVARSQGGGGGGGAASAEDLADLFNLELDKLRNQYERVERGRRQESDAQLDAVLEKLRELAQRQQQENERLRAWADRAGGAAAGPAGTRESQRRLAQEAEELARRLERLAREQSRPDLNATARRLQQAAEAMRRAAGGNPSEGAAQGRSAVDELREARRLLEREQRTGLRQTVDQALRRAERLAQQQEEMQSAVERLGPLGQRNAEQVRRLQERKIDMASELGDLEKELDRLGRELRREQPDAGRRLAEAAAFIRDAKVREKILFSRGVIQSRTPEYARNFEEQIGSDVGELRDRIRGARDAVGETREQRLARALDHTRDLVTGLESLGDRLRTGLEGPEALREGPQRPEGQRPEGPQRGAESGPGTPGAPVGPGGGGQGRLAPGDLRQFRREWQEQVSDARELRRLLQGEGVDVGDLDAIIARLRELDNRLAYGDPRALSVLETEIVQGLKEFEYAVRRRLDGGDDRKLFLGGSDEVPAGYRELVEAYFRALSEREPR